MHANLASIMPQVVAVWCQQLGHDVTVVDHDWDEVRSCSVFDAALAAVMTPPTAGDRRTTQQRRAQALADVWDLSLAEAKKLSPAAATTTKARTAPNP